MNAELHPNIVARHQPNTGRLAPFILVSGLALLSSSSPAWRSNRTNSGL
ncbi:MAG: hypothetical protein IT314_08390 [Anaerolineales bacterium]|nr:hypothetical protein [Anaerolineales bacterium]